eukprot:363889-Chlamydomonas_euryale.AAC.4
MTPRSFPEPRRAEPKVGGRAEQSGDLAAPQSKVVHGRPCRARWCTGGHAEQGDARAAMQSKGMNWRTASAEA